MLKNYWYAVEFGAAVQDTPVQVRVFDQDLVLYRNSQGEIICHSDICIHRGGSLAGGKVHGDCISCPYHGWQFDEQGACVKIPANRAGLPIPKKARVDTYPVVERYGYVFVFLGDLPEAERPPMPVLPLLEPTKDARATDNRIITGQFEWEANYERVLENGVDAAHAPFVHSTSFGNPDKPEIEDFDLQESVVGGHLTSAVYTVHLEPPEPKGIWKLIAKKNAVRPPIETGNGLYFPNVTFLQVKLPLGAAPPATAW
jgi:phenylpropionate dioxygenase-like ring-hydroxylating dioxygenase large terminal subunit